MIRQFQELEKRFEKSKFNASFLIAIFKNYQLTTSEFFTTYYCIGNPFDFLSGEVMLLWYGNKTDHLFKKKNKGDSWGRELGGKYRESPCYPGRSRVLDGTG